MRSVFVFLRDTTEAAVTAYLDAAYPEQRGPWVMRQREDAYLYIDIYRDGPREFESDEWADIARRFREEPAVVVIADVSGRHPGDEQTVAFVAGLLTQFAGSAMDEYTPHLWSLAQLRSGYRVGGHLFFDYNGWFAERRAKRRTRFMAS